MYEEYFRLSGAPFKLNPDPRFFFGSRSHNKAMAYLHYGLKQAEGFIVITGPVGAGKSMLIGHLLDQLNSSNVVAAHLLTSNVEPGELLGHILSAFRIEPEGEGRTGQLEAFEDYLFDQLQRGRRVLLIMDEAQNLPHKTLEELRMLSNIDYDGTPLFQVFLVGQPEFRDTMESAPLEQLRQRVIASYHLENMMDEETQEYIQHRLSVVGWREDPIFSADAFQAIFDETEGLPRRINTLCNRLMLYCSLERRHEITREVVETVLAELREEKLAARDAKPVSMPRVKAVNGEGPQREDRRDASSMSVFDRLRVQRGAAEDETIDDARQEATLSDVATAIAEAAANQTEESVNRTPDKSSSDEDNALPAVKSEWRQLMARSINESRDELKRAHASISRLRQKISHIDKRRSENRGGVAVSLARAETLLKEIRDAWR